MEENILKIMEELKKLEKNFDYTELETAFYIYARYGVEDYRKEQIEEIYETLQNYDGSLFNEDINGATAEIIY